MTDGLDLFVDTMLDDVIRRWDAARDAEPAADRPECQQAWLRTGQLAACKRYAALVRHGRPQDRRVRQLRGLCREQQFVRALCLGQLARGTNGRLHRVPPGAGGGNIDMRWQVRVQPDNRRSPVADAVDVRNRVAYEHKSLYAPHYLLRDAAGRMTRVNRARLAERVALDAGQVRRQRGWGARAGRWSVIPAGFRHELVYRLENPPLVPATRARMHEVIVATAARLGVRAHIL